MEVRRDEVISYLEDVHSGKIKEGLKIDCATDEYFRYKQGTFNMILGLDNVGKTYWRTWYYLVIAVKYGKTFGVWSGENKAGSIVKNLSQMLAQKPFMDFTTSEIHRYSQEVLYMIKFVDNKEMYEFKQLLDIFEELNVDCGLIDPLTGIKRKMGHEANYELLNTGRQWVNSTGKSLDLCLHPISEASRNRFFPADHPWAGQIREPSKTFAEGGQPFASRCDDYYIIHRLPKLESMKYQTIVHIDKIKETETGGQQTPYDEPLLMNFNSGMGFTIGGVNPLIKKEPQQEMKLEPNKEFEKPKYNPEPIQEITQEDLDELDEFTHKEEWD